MRGYLLLLIYLFTPQSVFCGPPAYKYDYRRNYKKNQASPGIYFDPESGNFKRGNPPADLLEKSKRLREEVSGDLRSELPFAKFSQNDHQKESNHAR